MKKVKIGTDVTSEKLAGKEDLAEEELLLRSLPLSSTAFEALLETQQTASFDPVFIFKPNKMTKASLLLIWYSGIPCLRFRKGGNEKFA